MSHSLAAVVQTGLYRTFFFELLLTGLIWGVWVVLNLWIWQKTKALANMLMLIGSGILALSNILHSFATGPGFWLDFFGVVLLTVGFVLSVKTLVDAQLAMLKSKLQGSG